MIKSHVLYRLSYALASKEAVWRRGPSLSGSSAGYHENAEDVAVVHCGAKSGRRNPGHGPRCCRTGCVGGAPVSVNRRACQPTGGRPDLLGFEGG